jgi:formylglycine-generating enzyme required for sulfatase activity
VLSAVPAALSNKNYQVAIKSISQYLGEIANAGIQDPQLQQMLAEAKGKESASIRNKKLVKLGIAAACVVVVLIAGVVIKINNDAKALETAIAAGNWETVLELDSDNAEGLRMQAAAEKAAAEKVAAVEKAAKITAALAKSDWETVLALDPGNIEGLRLQDAAEEKDAADKAAAEKAAAVAAALAKGDWKVVLALDPDNSDGIQMQAAAEKAAKITAALARGDWKVVLALDPDNSEGLQMQAVAAEKAAAVAVALAQGDWKAVLSLDPTNSEGLQLKAAAEKAAILARAPITNTIGMKLKEIPAGTFLMGSPSDETGREDNETQHPVTISKAFYMQTTEVTQGQWKAVMGTEPWKGEQYVKEGPNYPATYVSWNDAIAYCKKLSEKEGKTYRLPTEAEWEYACRAGTKTAWSFGDDEKALGDYAWYRENAYDIDERYAHQVELKKPNAFGLYDMHGNVWEWCHDYYVEDYYKQSPEQDPRGLASGSSRVLRGGSWVYDSRDSRSAFRDGRDAGSRNGVYGFRLVRELD